MQMFLFYDLITNDLRLDILFGIFFVLRTLIAHIWSLIKCIVLYVCSKSLHYSTLLLEHIGRLARMSVLDTDVDGSNPGSSMLFP